MFSEIFNSCRNYINSFIISNLFISMSCSLLQFQSPYLFPSHLTIIFEPNHTLVFFIFFYHLKVIFELYFGLISFLVANRFNLYSSNLLIEPHFDKFYFLDQSCLIFIFFFFSFFELNRPSNQIQIFLSKISSIYYTIYSIIFY